MIEGTYRFILDGEVVAEQKNALTAAGRSIAIKSLLGIVPNFAGVISYGIGDEANSLDSNTNLIENNVLQFEVGRTPVRGSSLDLSTSTDVLVYSGVIESTEEFKVHEVGLYPGGINKTTVDITGSTLFDFDRIDIFSKLGTASGLALVQAAEARIGATFLSLPPTDGTDSYISYSSNDNAMSLIDNYVSADTFRLAGLDLNEFSSSVNVRFYTDSNNYYDYIFTTPSSSGYFISTTEKGSSTITGAPTWENITSVRIWQNSASSVYLDAMKIDFGSYYDDRFMGMISRAVLAEPVRKPPGIPLTIEYSLSVGFNQI